MKIPQEKDLVANAKAGDRSALDELLRLHRDRLASWICTRVGPKVRSKVGIEDLVQESQLRAFQSIERFTWRGEGSFERWLRAIAEHLVWSASQKRSFEELTLSDRPAIVVSPSRHGRRAERLDRLERALAGLRPEEREALRLSKFEGLLIREIAERLNKTESAVKSLISRSLRKLRESFGDTESFHLPDRRIDLREGGREP